MPKRVTDEERIVVFFSTETPERVLTMWNVVQGLVRDRDLIHRPRRRSTLEPVPHKETK